MAKGTEKSGMGLALLAIIGTFVFILFSNLFNFSMAVNYGPKQYALNIKNFHSDYYCKSNKKLKIYDEIVKASEIGKVQGVGVLKPETRFKLKGYQEKRSVTWVAIETFNKNEVINGFVFIPKLLDISTFWTSVPLGGEDKVSNNYFSLVGGETTANYKNELNRKAKAILKRDFPIKTASGEINVQKIKESDQYEIIEQFSKTNFAYYSSKEIYPKIDNLIESYIGDNFETNYLQLNSKYDPIKDGVYSKKLLLFILDKWYFKLASPFIILFLISFIFREKHSCPKCNSSNFEVQNKNLISESYKYEKANKERDKRYKDNPLIRRITVTYNCNKCTNIWSEEVVEYSDNNKGQFKFKEKAKPIQNDNNLVNNNNVNTDQEFGCGIRKKLIKLKKLYEVGKIDSEEYAAVKSKLLKAI
jgi:hypothetical protein